MKVRDLTIGKAVEICESQGLDCCSCPLFITIDKSGDKACFGYRLRRGLKHLLNTEIHQGDSKR